MGLDACIPTSGLVCIWGNELPANCFASELNMLLVHASLRRTAKQVSGGENDFLSGVFMRCDCIHLIIIIIKSKRVEMNGNQKRWRPLFVSPWTGDWFLR